MSAPLTAVVSAPQAATPIFAPPMSEGYKLLVIFNWSDHFPVWGWLDLQGVRKRCRDLVGKVNAFVGKIIDEHRTKRVQKGGSVEEEEESSTSRKGSIDTTFLLLMYVIVGVDVRTRCINQPSLTKRSKREKKILDSPSPSLASSRYVGKIISPFCCHWNLR